MPDNILVQKGAPLDLLLGTDLHSKLGFQFLKTKSGGTAVDLLQGEKWTVEQPLPMDTSPSSPPELLFEADQEATVCLLQPVKYQLGTQDLFELMQ